MAAGMRFRWAAFRGNKEFRPSALAKPLLRAQPPRIASYPSGLVSISSVSSTGSSRTGTRCRYWLSWSSCSRCFRRAQSNLSVLPRSCSAGNGGEHACISKRVMCSAWNGHRFRISGRWVAVSWLGCWIPGCSRHSATGRDLVECVEQFEQHRVHLLVACGGLGEHGLCILNLRALDQFMTARGDEQRKAFCRGLEVAL